MDIHDLPELVLVEILCRVPCGKFIFQCKCVCKRWLTLISAPYFIDRFLRLQSHRKTPTVRTLISRNAEELFNRVSLSEVFTPMLKRLESFDHLETEPVVVGAYNDLILCCDSLFDQHNYYICNPYTMQWVALPPTPTRCYDIVRVGFICDSPYYEEDDPDGRVIQLNAKFRCKVVRILPPDRQFVFDHDEYCFNFNVEIFSFETGKWSELVVSSPRGISYDYLDAMAFPYNGVLYWSGHDYGYFLVLGLDPFNDNSSTSTSSGSSNGGDIIDHKCRFVVFAMPVADHFVVECLGVCGGLLRMCDFDTDTKTLFVWDLKRQDHDYMVKGAGELCLSKHNVYSFDQDMYPDDARVVERLSFDPNNDDIFYLYVDADVIMCNIRTRKWSKIVEKRKLNNFYFFPFILPWWPTPVPSLPQHAHQLAHGEETSS
ncbi:hypothetical protein CerSpe_106780 [Prunus speciosa]